MAEAKNQTPKSHRTVDVTQMVEWSLPIPNSTNNYIGSYPIGTAWW